MDPGRPLDSRFFVKRAWGVLNLGPCLNPSNVRTPFTFGQGCLRKSRSKCVLSFGGFPFLPVLNGFSTHHSFSFGGGVLPPPKKKNRGHPFTTTRGACAFAAEVLAQALTAFGGELVVRFGGSRAVRGEMSADGIHFAPQSATMVETITLVGAG